MTLDGLMAVISRNSVGDKLVEAIDRY